ncbi:HD-GYP domain-containing protein [Streptomyces sp. NBC_01267]|uniref:HD-GYP domain-containing protein n=1 Tax=unclassified Streptomyces TaxID=2593676 RepID=UPI002E33D0DC|nr:HD-GYP domain-containing protein [Streptomyces sp. NBC_01267]
MRALPPSARACVLCAVLGALGCALPAVTDPATPWRAVALLAAVYAGCELLGRRSPGGGSFFPVLIAAALLLPPAAAALVAVPGALLGRVEDPPYTVRRIWHAAQLALAVRAAAEVPALLGGLDRRPEFPGVLLPAVVAALVLCLVLTVLDALVRVTAERLPVRTAGGVRGLPRSPAPYAVHGLAGVMMAVLWRSPFGPPAALFVLLPMYISSWVFAQYHRERAAHQATIRALVQAVDIKDRYTRGHSERVGQASAMIAGELGMDGDRLEALRFAGILHDVGKLGVPTRLLRKDGPLTPEERRVIELHPEYGHEMVRGIGFLGEARAAILHHHERLDGSGYPYGLSGDQIPEFARVVAIADAFDAMTSTRSYRRARPVDAALRELLRCAGTQFDPEFVRAFVRALTRHGWHPAVTADGPDAHRHGPLPPARAGTDGTATAATATDRDSPA